MPAATQSENAPRLWPGKCIASPLLRSQPAMNRGPIIPSRRRRRRPGVGSRARRAVLGFAPRGTLGTAGAGERQGMTRLGPALIGIGLVLALLSGIADGIGVGGHPDFG